MSSLTYRQEILAEDIDEIPGALWTRSVIENNRKSYPETLTRVVVGVDPPGGSTECGIIISAVGPCDCLGKEETHGFILGDYSLSGSPDRWASEVVTAYLDHECDRILAEANFGGDMVKSTIQMAANAQNVRISYADVRASRGKAVRAEPVAALYEQGKIHHVGKLNLLEDELCTWESTSTWSPNRLDALVWGITNLMVQRQRSAVRFIE
jgi:phage terminase large subunit-like protein